MIYINRHENYQEVPLNTIQGLGDIYFNEKFIPITNTIIAGVYDWYMISNFGKIYDKYKGEVLKQYNYYSNGNQNKPYCSVNLKTEYGIKCFRVHRLVMACFYPELGPIDQNKDINHKDGVTNNNFVSYNDPSRGNIEWMHHRDNVIHAYDTGLHQTGEDNVHSKITNETAIQIINLLTTNLYTSKQIVDIVGNNVTTLIVDNIRKKEAWTRLSEGIEFYQRPRRQFTEQDIENFCAYFQSKYPKPENLTINKLCREALICNGFEPDKRYVETLRKLYARKYYTQISSKYIF